jgi:DEAD/DEAH box helicase domain-containing protein
MDPARVLDEIQSRQGYAGQIVRHIELPARPPHFRDPASPLSASAVESLNQRGIGHLYSHQIEALDALQAGRNVTVVSGTASGKTLTYLLPIVEEVTRYPHARALLLYPTKALAQDQLRKLKEWGAGELFSAATYDGDTPLSTRRGIKKEAQVVLSNPDMLHVGILPCHHTWADFLRNLRFVVLDEVHTYRGIFGSHAALVLRRLRRLCRHYGSDPRFICCSATIANPAELAEQLTGLETSLVSEDGAPRGARQLLFWNPPVIDKATGARRSGNLEAADLLATLVRKGVRTIAFTLARSQSELILRYTRERLQEDGLADKVMAYRGGYLPKERRAIEKRLFNGELLGVTATTALELGVDIGGLDAAILVGYPGSVASFWQQVGRAGRSQQSSLGFLIGLQGPVHQYVVNHPEYVLAAASERAIIDTANPFILAGHLLCAAYELPVDDTETDLFGERLTPALEILGQAGYLARRSRWYWIDPDLYPAGSINIRSASGTAYEIRCLPEDRLLGTVDAGSALRIVHPGAVYLHAGETYVVQSLDLEERVARVAADSVDYYTTALTQSDVTKLDPLEVGAAVGDVALELSGVSVRSQVIGYRRSRPTHDEALAIEPLELPASEFETVGLWLLPDEAAMHPEGLPVGDPAGALHAVEHVLITLLPLFSLCEARDVGGASSVLYPGLGEPAICLYDGYPGGIGIAQSLLPRLPELLAAAAATIEACPCSDGCPACVQQMGCGSFNEPLDKRGALTLLCHWLAGAKPTG